MSDPSPTTVVLNSWEVAAISMGPIIACLYAIATSLFNWMWNEQPIGFYLGHLLPRNTVLIMLISFLMNYNTNNEHMWPLVTAMFFSWVITYYLITDTKIEIVQGGLPPLPEVLSNATGKVILVTGANAGIGKETVRQLYEAGAEVIVACRSLIKAEDTIQELTRNGTSKGSLSAIEIDLNKLESIRNAATKIQKNHKRLDVIICNAGVMMHEQQMTVDGFDMVWQANYLGHALLCHLLWKLLKKSSNDPRVIQVTSSTYSLVGNRLPLHDLQCREGRVYSLFGQYAVTKLAQILWCQQSSKDGVWTAAVHPGLVRTDVVRNMPGILQFLNRQFDAVLRLLQKTPTEGAWGSVHAALAPNLPSSRYWVNRQPVPLTVSSTYMEEDGQELMRQTLAMFEKKSS